LLYLPFNSAQRLAAQPLGRFRYAVTILAGYLKPHISVRSQSLGQVGCSRVLGGKLFIYLQIILMIPRCIVL
jgi:hypothetical protein